MKREEEKLNCTFKPLRYSKRDLRLKSDRMGKDSLSSMRYGYI